MTVKKIKSSDILGDNYYTYDLTSSNYTPNLNSSITITCTVKNIYGDIITNKSVQLYQNDVAVGNAKTTNNNGVVTWTVTCSTAGVQKFSIKDNIIEVFVDTTSKTGHNHTTSDITNFPTIPTKTSDLTDDIGFLTEHNPIDSQLSSTSTNAVQNKVVNTAINNMGQSLNAVYEGAQNYTNGVLGGYVSKNDIQNDLTSTDVLKVLSANQGKELKTLIDGKASSSHSHGNITNDGKLGSTANKPLMTTTNGLISLGSFGNSANSFCEGNDRRLSDSRTPKAHTHTTSDITNFPTIPTKTSDLTDDIGFLTEHNPIDNEFSSTSTNAVENKVVFNNFQNLSNAFSEQMTNLWGTLSGKEDKSNKITSWSKTSSVTKYPSEKLVKDELDNKANSSDIPTNNNQLVNGAGYITSSTLVSHNTSDAAHSDIRNILSNKANSSDIPTKTSDLTNDSGYLTSHQDITGKEDKSNKVTSWSSTTTDTHYPSEKLVKDSLDNKANSTHNHTKNQITDFPTIPTKTSDLTNDSNFISTSSTNGLIKNNGTIDTNTYLTTSNASSTYVAKENGKGLFSGSYNDLTDKPNIPTQITVDNTVTQNSSNPVKSSGIFSALKTKQDDIVGLGYLTDLYGNIIFEDDGDFFYGINGRIYYDITNTNELHYFKSDDTDVSFDDIALIDDIPTNTSDLTNDSGYLTANDKVGTFGELQTLINNASSGSTIRLDKDYKNSGNESNITLNKSLTIQGNGHTIDADSKSRILLLTGNTGEIIINETTFINGLLNDGESSFIPNGTEKGGAINGVGYDGNLTINNCFFYNNHCNNKGGALYSKKLNVYNSIFLGNSSVNGGAIYCENNSSIIKNCIFKNNSVNVSGEDIYCQSSGLIIYNCDVYSDEQYYLNGAINKPYLTDHQDLTNYLTTSNASSTYLTKTDASNTYLTSHQDISGKENISNKSSSIFSDTGSTTKYPTVKAVEDYADNYVTGTNFNKTVDDLEDEIDNKADSNHTHSISNVISLQTTLNNKLEENDLLNLVYPIGSIYMSVVATDPDILFGGTWEQIEDMFLLASGTTYTPTYDSNGFANKTDGEATHTLTTNEMPSHTHSPPSWVHYASSNGNTGNYSVTRITANNGNTYVNSTPQTNKDTGSTGGGQAHNNMPPYLVVNVWKRIA